MLRHSWISEVLDDIQLYAHLNGLEEVAASVGRTRCIVIKELAHLKSHNQPCGSPSGDGDDVLDD